MYNIIIIYNLYLLVVEISGDIYRFQCPSLPLPRVQPIPGLSSPTRPPLSTPYLAIELSQGHGSEQQEREQQHAWHRHTCGPGTGGAAARTPWALPPHRCDTCASTGQQRVRMTRRRTPCATVLPASHHQHELQQLINGNLSPAFAAMAKPRRVCPRA